LVLEGDLAVFVVLETEGEDLVLGGEMESRSRENAVHEEFGAGESTGCDCLGPERRGFVSAVEGVGCASGPVVHELQVEVIELRRREALAVAGFCDSTAVV
jgi:hypothetical protein